MILDFFLVTAHLALQLVHHQIHGGHDVVVALTGDEIVLVLRGDQKFDDLHFILQIHGYLDLGQAFEVTQQLFRLFANKLLGGFG